MNIRILGQMTDRGAQYLFRGISVFLRRDRRRSAELHSAVSRICNPPGVASSKRFGIAPRFAECNSAIQQIANLRYQAQRRNPFGILPSCRAYSLLELVGVLAILAILVAALVPPLIRKIDQAAWSKETADLSTMADALQQSVLRSKTIPTYTGIPAAIANELALPLSAITNTPRRYTRAFLVDADLRINGAVLPYTQTVSTAISQPVKARLMIISSQALALPVASGIPSATAFSDIWDAAENTKPASWTNWAGKGRDLRIQRINLEPTFHRLVLVNRDTNGACRFSINSTNSTAVPAGPAGCDAYYLDGSVVGLHDRTGTTVTKYLLKRDISFVFERDQWRGWIGPGDPYYTTADAFARESADFLAADWNTNSKKGASQTGVLVAMYVFMFNYTLWAEECPLRFSYHGTTSISQVPEYSILDSLGKNQGGGILYDASGNLLSP